MIIVKIILKMLLGDRNHCCNCWTAVATLYRYRQYSWLFWNWTQKKITPFYLHQVMILCWYIFCGTQSSTISWCIKVRMCWVIFSAVLLKFINKYCSHLWTWPRFLCRQMDLPRPVESLASSQWLTGGLSLHSVVVLNNSHRRAESHYLNTQEIIGHFTPRDYGTILTTAVFLPWLS